VTRSALQFLDLYMTSVFARISLSPAFGVAGFSPALTVALGCLEPRQYPMAHFPKIKAAPRKLPTTLSREEVSALLHSPKTDTVLGIRDRALLTLLYGTGMRASECAGLAHKDIPWEEGLLRLLGNRGQERSVPLNEEVVHVLRQYRLARGGAKPHEPFFRSREGRALSRNAIFSSPRRTCAKPPTNIR
jgi:site-specific recombinase XerD